MEAIYSQINLIKKFTYEPDDFRNYLRMGQATYLLVTSLIKSNNTVSAVILPNH